MRLNAYYYSFDGTGEEMIDRVLSAVAVAGKMFHGTDRWSDEIDGEPYEPFLRGSTCVEQIDNAAMDAAAEMARLRAEVARLRLLVKEACAVIDEAANETARNGRPISANVLRAHAADIRRHAERGVDATPEGEEADRG